MNGKLLKTKDRNTRKDIQKELRTLSKEERKRQQLAVTDVLKSADVILTTLIGAFSKKLDSTSFDLVIIDEAAQALEISCWIPLLKVVLKEYLPTTFNVIHYTSPLDFRLLFTSDYIHMPCFIAFLTAHIITSMVGGGRENREVIFHNRYI